MVLLVLNLLHFRALSRKRTEVIEVRMVLPIIKGLNADSHESYILEKTNDLGIHKFSYLLSNQFN